MMLALTNIRSSAIVWGLCVLSSIDIALAATDYFPPAGANWATKSPEALGLNGACIESAVAFAKANEVKWPLDVRTQIERDTAHEPFPEVVGPTTTRAAQNGLILRQGFIAAEWGDTHKVDMTFSVAKSYLATVAGLAVDRGLIASVNDPVRTLVRDGGFDSEQNETVTWHMLLNQTSEWEGTLWDKPDIADRRRGYARALLRPGELWEYNDVRVNRLALSLLRVFGKPLPQVLKEAVMDPIGASQDWVWHGYFNSYVTVDGQRMQSVSGGSHWGGGLWASTRDHARFGLLFARGGEWNGKRIVSRQWIAAMLAPTQLAPYYGYLWWLPHSTSPVFKSAPEGSFFALGSGGNMIWVDPKHDVVAVTRWLDIPKLDEFVRKLSACIVGTQ